MMRFLSSAASFFHRSRGNDHGERDLAEAFDGLEIELAALRALVSTMNAREPVDLARVEQYARTANDRIDGVPTETHIAAVMDRVSEILNPPAKSD